MGNKAKKLIMLCVLLLGCGLTGYFTYSEDDGRDNVNQLIVANREVAREQASRTMKIYVSGAVMAPGIYDIPIGVRAYEAVTAAGGMTDNADADRVNLAKRLKDGDHVNVPAVKNSLRKGSADRSSLSQAGAVGRSSSTVGSNKIDKEISNAKYEINVNTASQRELESLPGIGPAMAQRIIAERERRPFSSVEDLLRVKGIGPAKLSKIRNLVRVN